MYNNQPAPQGNNFYFNSAPPMPNPFADNPKFVKKALAKFPLLGIAICLGIYSAVQIYFAVTSFKAYSIIANAQSFLSTDDYSSFYFMTGCIYVGISFFSLLAFLGALTTYIKSRLTLNDNSVSTAGISMIFSVLTVMLVLTSVLILLLAIALILLLAFGNDMVSFLREYGTYDYSYYLTADYISQCAAYSAAAVIFSIIELVYFSCLIRLCSSVKLSLRGQTLSAVGARPVAVISVLNVFAIIAYTVFSFINGDISISASANIIISAISTVSMLVLNIFIMILALSYCREIESAKRSLNIYGVNPKTDSYSNLTAYYQSTYRDPNGNDNAPPMPVGFYQQPNQYSNPHNNPQQPAPNNPHIQLQKKPPVQYSTTKTEASEITSPLPPITREGTIKCSGCGAENEASSKFCINCGSPLSRPNGGVSLNK